ncbi:hypothetical protein [Nesterenkonia marinintestina]|uniref:hypothetical protein n=1 Tax=Nesterenkonia marinintestina TaxID=2979865 RepID=UPI0021BE7DCE|nr:hypothetical protein [Nesterenkonia sp. GX14115]
MTGKETAMLDDINNSIFGNASGLGLIAGWALALGAVFLTIWAAISVCRWVYGKLSRTSDEQTKGLRGAVLSFIGAAVLGTIAGGIAWSSSGGNQTDGLAALMPESARPGEVTIERDSPTVACDAAVTWEADTRTMSAQPTSEANTEGWQILDSLGIEPAVRETTDNIPYEYTDIKEITWIPDSESGDERDCSPENTTAVEETTIEVDIYEATGRFTMGTSFTYEYTANGELVDDETEEESDDESDEDSDED